MKVRSIRMGILLAIRTLEIRLTRRSDPGRSSSAAVSSSASARVCSRILELGSKPSSRMSSEKLYSFGRRRPIFTALTKVPLPCLV